MHVCFIICAFQCFYTRSDASSLVLVNRSNTPNIVWWSRNTRRKFPALVRHHDSHSSLVIYFRTCNAFRGHPQPERWGQCCPCHRVKTKAFAHSHSIMHPFAHLLARSPESRFGLNINNRTTTHKPAQKTHHTPLVYSMPRDTFHSQLCAYTHPPVHVRVSQRQSLRVCIPTDPRHSKRGVRGTHSTNAGLHLSRGAKGHARGHARGRARDAHPDPVSACS